MSGKARGKGYRDPNAPKRNLSAYLLYQHAMREQFRQQNPGMSFGELAKFTSQMYAQLTPAEKAFWQERAEADKYRYLQELSKYVPPPGYDAKGDAIVSQQPVGHGKKSGRDPNAPKRNMSAYLLYQNAMRDQFKEENPGMTFGQLAKYTSAMYKSLTPEERSHWEMRAAHDKARYNAEIQQYMPPPGYDNKGNLVEQPNGPYHGGGPHGSGQRRKKYKDPNAPKRARGSFVFFTFEHRPKLMAEQPDIKFVQMGNVLGQRWRELDPEEKKRYEDMAAQDKVRFAIEMERYKEQNPHLKDENV